MVAVASDGDVLARLDVTINAATMAMGREEHAAIASREHPARADEIRIERDRSGIEWAAIGLIIGAVGELGIGMGWRQRAA